MWQYRRTYVRSYTICRRILCEVWKLWKTRFKNQSFSLVEFGSCFFLHFFSQFAEAIIVSDRLWLMHLNICCLSACVSVCVFVRVCVKTSKSADGVKLQQTERKKAFYWMNARSEYYLFQNELMQWCVEWMLFLNFTSICELLCVCSSGKNTINLPYAPSCSMITTLSCLPPRNIATNEMIMEYNGTASIFHRILGPTFSHSWFCLKTIDRMFSNSKI